MKVISWLYFSKISRALRVFLLDILFHQQARETRRVSQRWQPYREPKEREKTTTCAEGDRVPQTQKIQAWCGGLWTAQGTPCSIAEVFSIGSHCRPIGKLIEQKCEWLDNRKLMQFYQFPFSVGYRTRRIRRGSTGPKERYRARLRYENTQKSWHVGKRTG